MKRHAALLLYVCALTLLCSCTSTPAVKPPLEWGYEKEAITVTLKGDPQLNLFQKSPHALVACLYQLRDPNAPSTSFGQSRTAWRSSWSAAGSTRELRQPSGS